MPQVNSKIAAQLTQTPTGVAAQDWPQPERIPQFLDKLGARMARDYDWSAEVRRLQVPVMLVHADHDVISTQHIAYLFALPGAGLEDPGWQNTRLTQARLAIAPGYSHCNSFAAPELGPIIEEFLADSLTEARWPRRRRRRNDRPASPTSSLGSCRRSPWWRPPDSPMHPTCFEGG